MQKFQSVWLPIRERLNRAGDNNKHANTNAIWAPLLSLVVLVVHPGGSSLLLNLIFVKKNSRFKSRHHFGKTLLVGLYHLFLLLYLFTKNNNINEKGYRQ